MLYLISTSKSLAVSKNFDKNRTKTKLEEKLYDAASKNIILIANNNQHNTFSPFCFVMKFQHNLPLKKGMVVLVGLG